MLLLGTGATLKRLRAGSVLVCANAAYQTDHSVRLVSLFHSIGFFVWCFFSLVLHWYIYLFILLFCFDFFSLLFAGFCVLWQVWLMRHQSADGQLNAHCTAWISDILCFVGCAVLQWVWYISEYWQSEWVNRLIRVNAWLWVANRSQCKLDYIPLWIAMFRFFFICRWFSASQVAGWVHVHFWMHSHEWHLSLVCVVFCFIRACIQSSDVNIVWSGDNY